MSRDSLDEILWAVFNHSDYWPYENRAKPKECVEQAKQAIHQLIDRAEEKADLLARLDELLQLGADEGNVNKYSERMKRLKLKGDIDE